MSTGITVDITANLARFSSSLDRATQDLSRFQTNAERIGKTLSSVFSGLGVGLGAAGFAGLIKGSIDAADNLKGLSKSTGLAVEQLAGLKLAASQSGTNLEDIGSAINNLSVNIGKNGDKFKKLGIDATDPIKAFQQLSDIFVSIENPQQRAALAAAALGKGWQTAAPLLAEGGKAIGEMVEKGTAFSGVTTQLAKNSDDLNDALDVMKTKLSGVASFVTGEILEGFSQLIGKINEASGEVKTFNSVLTGISNFSFNIDGIRGASVEIDNINNKIVAQKAKINAIQGNGFIGGLIDDVVGNDINLEKNRLDTLLKQREQVVKDFNTKQKLLKVDALPKPAPTTQQVQNFIGGETQTGSPKRSSTASAKPKATVDNTGADAIKSLEREVALLNQTSRIASTKYDIEFGNLSKIAPLQKDRILALTEELDKNKRRLDQEEELVRVANEAFDLRARVKELSISPEINLTQFNQGLADIQDKLKEGIINADEAKTQFDILGRGFNENFISPSLAGTDQLSEYASQAAKNIQDAFANFLFDPFADGMDGLLTSFRKILSQMASELILSQVSQAAKGFDWAGLASSIVGVFGGAAGSAFSGAASAASSVGDFTEQAVGKALSNVKLYASGGEFGGGLRIVGERGPELEATGPSRIFNADQTRQILGGGRGMTNNIVINVAAPSGRVEPQSLTQLRTSLERSLSRAGQRNS